MMEVNTKRFYIDKIWYLNIVLKENQRGVIYVSTIVMERSRVKHNPGALSNKLIQYY